MRTLTVSWKNGFEGQTTILVSIQTNVCPKEDVTSEWVDLTKRGWLTIRKGFAWDYASGPTFDWPEFTKLAALIHDAFCYLFRQGLISRENRKQADKFFYSILRANGSKIWWFRWRVWYRGVRVESGGDKKPKKIHTLTINLPEVEQ